MGENKREKESERNREKIKYENVIFIGKTMVLALYLQCTENNSFNNQRLAEWECAG